MPSYRKYLSYRSVIRKRKFNFKTEVRRTVAGILTTQKNPHTASRSGRDRRPSSPLSTRFPHSLFLRSLSLSLPFPLSHHLPHSLSPTGTSIPAALATVTTRTSCKTQKKYHRSAVNNHPTNFQPKPHRHHFHSPPAHITNKNTHHPHFQPLPYTRTATCTAPSC